MNRGRSERYKPVGHHGTGDAAKGVVAGDCADDCADISCGAASDSACPSTIRLSAFDGLRRMLVGGACWSAASSLEYSSCQRHAAMDLIKSSGRVIVFVLSQQRHIFEHASRLLRVLLSMLPPIVSCQFVERMCRLLLVCRTRR